MKGKRATAIIGAIAALSLAAPGMASATEGHSGTHNCASNQIATIASDTSTLGPPYGSYTTEHEYNGSPQYYYSYGGWRSYSPTLGSVSWYIYTNHSFNSYSVTCTAGIHVKS